MDEDLMFETGTKILEDRLKEADFDNIFVLFEQVMREHRELPVCI